MYKIQLGVQRSPLLTSTAPCVRAPHQNRGIVRIRAESGGLGDFFKKDDSKQDAARKALQDAFKGAKDPFAADEKRRKERGGGGNGGDGNGGGGGGGGFGGFNFNDFGDNFKKWFFNTMRAIAAAILFVGIISLFYLWNPLLSLLTKIIRVALRLDGNPRAQMAAGPAATPDFTKTDELGNVESSIISKYGGDGDVGEEDDSDEDEDESDDE